MLLPCQGISSESRFEIGDVRKLFSATAITIGLTLSTNLPPSNAIDAIDAAFRNSAITYSNNAKNFQRIAEGDYSQGSKDISTSKAALKRRAVKGCKTERLRVQSGLNEIDCMVKTFSGDIQFMLDIIDSTEKIQ